MCINCMKRMCLEKINKEKTYFSFPKINDIILKGRYTGNS